MAVTPGTRFGPYEVVAPLGEGGMGEVHRATDTRLGRTVALKVLGPETVRDPAARERFEREARLIAQLQHPHICVLHDVGVEGDTPYLVMELLAGETLDARLTRGRLPLDDALALGAQIAQALDAAHRQGIVHRDLKPANVMLVKGASGTDAKLLDFGVARPVASRVGLHADDATSVTGATTAALTDRHTLVGTLPYMAPEQLAGQPADARTDVWALGCVLYEMLTGARPFAGQTTASLMAAILEQPPQPLADRAPLTPPLVSHLVGRCLEKDPERRWQSARDVAMELDWARGNSSGGVAARPKGIRRSWLVPAMAAIALVASGLLWGLSRSRDVSPSTGPRIDLEVGALTDSPLPAFAVSPDGQTIVGNFFQQSPTLAVRMLGSTALVPLQTSGLAMTPSFSPDGQWVAYVETDNESRATSAALRRVAVTGGEVATILPSIRSAADYRGSAWLSDHTMVVSLADKRGTTTVPYSLRRVPDIGGDMTTVASAPDLAFVWPQALPDNEHVLCTTIPTVEEPRPSVSVVSLRTGAHRVVLDDAYFGRYSTTGHLLFVRGGALRAQRFDPATLGVSGPIETVAAAVDTQVGVTFAAQVAVAANADVIAWAPPPPRELPVAVVDRRGAVARRLTDRRDFRHPHLSSDGTQLAIGTERPRRDIWLMDLERDVLSPLVTSPDEDETPVWSGRRIIFAATRGGKSSVVEIQIDDPAAERIIHQSSNHLHVNAVAPDGSFALVNEGHPDTGQDIVKLSLHAPYGVEPFVHTRFDEYGAAISPNGRFVAYVSTETGRPEIYVKPLGSPGREQVSRSGGREPMWHPNGSELVFRRNRTFVAVATPATLGGRWGVERPLFDLNARAGTRDPSYAILPDGRFLVMLADETVEATPATVMVNRLSQRATGSP